MIHSDVNTMTISDTSAILNYLLHPSNIRINAKENKFFQGYIQYVL